MQLTPQKLRGMVRDAYSSAAAHPRDRHAFPVGREFAQSLGYPSHLLNGLPATTVEAFTGVSDFALRADIVPGATVLDLGCGAGLDTLIAARSAGSAGAVIGIDFSPSMLDRARTGVRESATRNVLLCRANAELLPLPRASIEVALANGIFNLNPARAAIFSELSRVVAPGGAVYAAELILQGPLPPDDPMSESNWFA